MKFVCAFLVAVSIIGSANGADIYVNASACNDYNSVAANYLYSLGLKTDGSIVGWGNNSYGQVTPPAGNDYIAVAAGYGHGLALKSDGSIVGWGDNSWGKATPPDGNDYTAVSAGDYHSIALKSDGNLIVWGGWWGTMPPASNDYIAVSAAYGFNIALKSDGSIVAWGSDEYGQVSNAPDGNDYVAISTGYFHCLALRSNGSIAAWGRNDCGQATPPSGNNYTAVSAGRLHSLALTNSGSIVAWGDNTYNQTTTPDGNDYIKIAAGNIHSLAIRSNKSVVGWGYNGFGESTPPAGGANDGSSWLDAFIDLQDALDAAVSTDTILVAAGTYYPSSQIISGNQRSAAFSLKNGVTVLGGFAAAGEPNLSDRNPQLYKTILSGDLDKNDGTGFTSRSDNCYHVLFADAAKALNNTAILDGFTISSGQADGSTPHNAGGGMYNHTSSPKVINCKFTDNQGQLGGAVLNQSCSPKFINSIIAANNAIFYGGGLANLTASPSLVNCAVYGNNAVTSGGGFYNATSSYPVLTNCIVWANTNGATPSPNQIFDSASTTTATYCDVQDGFWGLGNINTDPHFVNAGDNDFHLEYDSVCIDAGLNSVITAANDFEMDTRICHSNVDMGPDEVIGYAIAISAEPVAGGTIAFDPNYVIFAAGTEVNVSAVENIGYTFDHWSGALSGSANPASLTIAGNTSLTAHFIFTGEIIYVDDSSSATEPNGKSWQYAFKDLEPALATAGPGNQIWVAKGTYYPSRVIYFNYPRSVAYQLKNSVPVLGSFHGNEDRATFNTDSRDFEADETILSADIGLPGFDFDNAYHVFLHPDELALNASALLDGFTLTAANADFGSIAWGYNGGGMYNNIASPTIRNCKFVNNKANNCGGIYNYESSPVITNCTFLNNSSQQSAGAMSNPYSSPVISGCVFRGNSAVNAAGGMWNEQGIATITDCLFEENVANSGGGIQNGTGGNAVIKNCSFINNTGNGVWNYNCSPVITGCLFRGNTRSWGSGMANQTASTKISNCLFIESGTASSSGILYNHASSAPVVVNCTFANNTTTPSGVIVNNESSMTMTNSIVWGNNYNNINNMNGSYAVVTYTDFQGGYAGTGNINIDPMFTDTTSDDYHLQPGSLCIDVGNNSAVPESVIDDMDGTPRIIDGNCDIVAMVDMGCYEFSHKWFGDLNEDCEVNLLDIAILGNHWETNSAQADIAPGYGDGFVNIFDLAKIAENWLEFFD